MSIVRSLTKATIGTVMLPVAAVADVVTLGGLLSDRENTYIGHCAGDIMDNLKKAVEPER